MSGTRLWPMAGGPAGAEAGARAQVDQLEHALLVRQHQVVRLDVAVHQTGAVYRGQALQQGLTLVHFSAQPEPVLTQNTP